MSRGQIFLGHAVIRNTSITIKVNISKKEAMICKHLLRCIMQCKILVESKILSLNNI